MRYHLVIENLTSPENVDKFKDMPVEIFEREWATPQEGLILKNTFAMHLNLFRQRTFSGMAVHFRDGYFATAKHCFEKTILEIDDKTQIALETTDRKVVIVHIQIIAAGAEMYEHTRGTNGTDWLIFKVISPDMHFPNLPPEILSPPHFANKKGRAVMVGIPRNIQIQKEGAEPIENVGEQMTVRQNSDANLRHFFPKTEVALGDTSPLEITVEIGSTPGYSGGPIIIEGRYLGGIAHSTDLESTTFGVSTPLLLNKINSLE